jgi:cysteine-rich repeat protein
MRIVSTVPFVLAAALFGGCLVGDDSVPTESTNVARLSGAIFTTTANGDRVDANIYPAKSAVYLDGGPGNSAPSGAAALPEGDYYFQVTDPSGKVLLSTDAIQCRRFHVSGYGVITSVYTASGCAHQTGVDNDHSALGAITVQLMPYLNTPNPGGEYKAWATRVSEYDASKTQFHGFLPSESKTDNFKIVALVQPPPPPPCCGDGHLDTGEQCDDGNTVNGDGCDATCQTEAPPPPPPCCGDGHVDTGEQCDDGNTVNGDGCDSTCQTEAPPPPPEACCGDGHVDGAEQCDDGNTVSGDGCDSNCQLEPVCTPAMSIE